MNLKQAVETLGAALREDEGLRETYKANIAMSFKDEYARYKEGKSYINSKGLHVIANQAADNFLDLFIGNSVD